MLWTDGYDIAEIMIIIEKEVMCEWYHTHKYVCALWNYISVNLWNYVKHLDIPKMNWYAL